MKTYRLIKAYPGSPKLGFILKQKSGSIDAENYPEFWKPIVEKNYEILSLIEDKLIYNCDKYSKDYINQLFNTIGVNIHSVKRLSDSEIFTIGDMVKCEDCKGIITCLEIYGNDIYLTGVDKKMPFGYQLCTPLDCDEIPQKIKKPLFTTEDGVDIFEGNTFYYVKFTQYNMTVGKPFEIVKCNHPTFKYEPQYEKYFSTKEKAEEYVLMNKPVLSLKEIKETTTIKGLSLKKLEKLVQQKIKQIN